MDLSTFIAVHIDPLAEDWVRLARSLPGGPQRPADALRDHAAGLLRAIADDLRPDASAAPAPARSGGRALRLSARTAQDQAHAAGRPGADFGLAALVAGLCALRAVVLRQWALQRGQPSAEMPGQLVPFNEGIDQAIAESIARFVEDTGHLERAAAGRLHAALEEAQMACWEWEASADRLVASSTIGVLYGLRPGQAISSMQDCFALLHPDDRQRHPAIVRAAAARRQGWHARFRIVRPRDGKVCWLEERATPASEPGRTLTTGLVRDITDRVDAEDSLREAERRKDRFLATLAHELRNPLAPILQAAAVARSESAPLAQLRWCMEVIDRQAARLAQLLDALMDVSRVTGGRLQLQCRTLAVADLVRAAVETVAPAFQARRQALDVQIPPGSVYLRADPLRLTQGLGTLLANASQYSAPGATVRLAVDCRDGGVELSVVDQGIGIAAERLDTVFEMFGPDAAGAEPGGLGVGLALAKGLVELHGGTLVARSAGCGHGARFTVRLPLAPPPGAGDGGSAQAAACAPAAARVLVIDDNVDAADSLAALLRLRGHEVRTAHGGAAGLAQAAAFHPDLVLLDLCMPQMDGFEVARRLRAMPGGDQLTLAALTGWGQPADRDRTRAAGFDFHFTKPLDEAKLDPALLEALRRREQG